MPRATGAARRESPSRRFQDPELREQLSQRAVPSLAKYAANLLRHDLVDERLRALWRRCRRRSSRMSPDREDLRVLVHVRKLGDHDVVDDLRGYLSR